MSESNDMSGTGPDTQVKGSADPTAGTPHRAMMWSVAVMLGVGAVAGAYGFTQIVTTEQAAIASDGKTVGQGSEKDPTVTLPDSDGDGVPDGFVDEKDVDTETPKPAETPEEHPAPEPEPAPAIYTIQQGDTLSEISGETGVPLDVLVAENGIQNPNLIYAGASLIIPPVS